MPNRNETMREQLFDTLEIGGLDELHPDTREMVTRHILNMDDGPFMRLLGVIHNAKVAYAKREAQ